MENNKTAKYKSKKFALRIVQLYKFLTTLKETEETLYWLELLKDAEFIDEKSYNSIFVDCQEIAKMLTQTTKTMQNKLGNK